VRAEGLPVLSVRRAPDLAQQSLVCQQPAAVAHQCREQPVLASCRARRSMVARHRPIAPRFLVTALLAAIWDSTSSRYASSVLSSSV